MRARKIFLDRLRIAATCAVVLLHVVTGVMDNTDMEVYPFERRVFMATLDLVCWCVPTFLLISGYLFLGPGRKIGMKEMVCRYGRRIILALFLFGAPYACMEQVATAHEFRWSMVGRSFLMVLRGESWAHMWYLYMILLLYLLTPGLRWLLDHIPRPVICGLLAVLFILCSVLPYVENLFSLEGLDLLPEETIYFFYYISGHLFATRNAGGHAERAGKMQRPKVTEKMERPGETKGVGKAEKFGKAGKFGQTKRPGGWMLWGAALLAAGMAASRLTGTYTVRMAYNYPFTVALSLLLFGRECAAGAGETERQRGERPGRKLFREQAAALSFAVYLVHPVFLNTAYKVFHITPLSFAVGISLPVFWVCTLSLSVLTAWILRKIPPLRKYVL